MSAPVHVVVNTAAGTTAQRDVVAGLAEHFGSAGVKAKVERVEPGAELIEAIRRAVSQRPQVIVIGGGDGTLNSAAQLMVGAGITLGILPLGTLNHFAKDLHVPLDIHAAVKNIAAGHVVTIDVGIVSGHYFLNNSSLGLYPRVVRKRDVERHRLRLGKWPAFVFAALSVLRRFPFLDVRLSVDGMEIARRTPFVFIGNNRYEMEGFRIGRRAHLDRGELSLYVTNRVGRLGLLKLALRALFRRLNQTRDFESVSAKEIAIDTRRHRLHVATDGEVSIMPTPLRYRVLPGALSVIVPKTEITV
jgi:diacylglycerol kinase family enzyme